MEKQHTGGSSMAAMIFKRPPHPSEDRGLKTEDRNDAVPLGSARPTHARRGAMDVMGFVLVGIVWRTGHDFRAQRRVGRKHAMNADQVQARARARHQRSQTLHEFQRRHDGMRRAVAQGTLWLQHDSGSAATGRA